MKDKEEQLDKVFRQKLKDFELDVSDNLLNNIKKEIVEQNRKINFALWKWIFSFIVLIALSAGTINYFLNNKNNELKNKIANVSINSSNEKNNSEDKTINFDKNKNLLSNNEIKNEKKNNLLIKESQKVIDVSPLKINAATNIEKDEEEESKVLALQKSTKVEKKFSPTNKIVEEKNKQNKRTTLVKEGDNSSTKIHSKNTSLTEIEKNRSNEIAEGEIKSFETETSLNKISQPTTLAANTVEAESNLLKENKMKEKINPNSNAIEPSISKTDSITTIAKTNSSDSINSKPVLPVSENKSQDKKIAFYFDLNGGLSISNSIIKSGLLSSNSDSLQNNKKTIESKNIFSYNFGIDFGLISKNNLIINAGVGIDNKGEKYNYTTPTSGMYDTIYFTHLDSLLGTVIDSTHAIYTTTNGSTQVVKNNYKFLKIPLMVGYCFNVKDKLFVKPTVGITFNFLLNANSTWSDTEHYEMKNYSKGSGVFQNIAIAGRFKIDIGFKIKNKLMISIQPAYTRYFQSVYKPAYLDLKPYSYDINVGIGYKF